MGKYVYGLYTGHFKVVKYFHGTNRGVYVHM